MCRGTLAPVRPWNVPPGICAFIIHFLVHRSNPKPLLHWWQHTRLYRCNVCFAQTYFASLQVCAPLLYRVRSQLHFRVTFACFSLFITPTSHVSTFRVQINITIKRKIKVCSSCWERAWDFKTLLCFSRRNVVSQRVLRLYCALSRFRVRVYMGCSVSMYVEFPYSMGGICKSSKSVYVTWITILFVCILMIKCACVQNATPYTHVPIMLQLVCRTQSQSLVIDAKTGTSGGDSCEPYLCRVSTH